MSPEEIIIESPDGNVIEPLHSEARWQKQGEPVEPISVEWLLAEEHHRIYGRPWILGRFYMDFLVAHGLAPNDRVLDLGCGAGRVGIWLIPYLERGRYFGIDWHLKSLAAFARYEAKLHDLAHKAPRLMLSANFEVDRFGETFDVALDFYVTRHLTLEQTEAAYRKVRAVLRTGGRFFLPHAPQLDEAKLAGLGLALSESEEVSYPLLGEISKNILSTDHWHILRAV